MKYVSPVLSLLAILVAGYVLLTRSSDNQNSSEPVYETPEEVPAPFINAKTLELPTELTFAGETVPMEIPDVRERLDRELHINTYWHNNTIFLIKRANRWLPQIEEILAEYGIPEDFKYVSVIESSLVNDTSPAGAVGFWQFMKGTARDYNLEVGTDVDERYHPIKATHAAARYLKKAYEKFGNWTTVAAAYNRGMAGVNRALDRQKVESYYDLYLNHETSRYMFRVLAIKEIIENPGKYGFEIDEEHLYQPEPLSYIEVRESIPDLVNWSVENGINYKLLKRHNPWLRNDRLRIKAGNFYEIAIPAVQVDISK